VEKDPPRSDRGRQARLLAIPGRPVRPMQAAVPRPGYWVMARHLGRPRPHALLAPSRLCRLRPRPGAPRVQHIGRSNRQGRAHGDAHGIYRAFGGLLVRPAVSEVVPGARI